MSTTAAQRSLSTNRKKRGVVRASITKLRTRLAEVEASASLPDTVDHAKHLSARLQSLAEDFKLHHYAIVELVDAEADLQKEQEILDGHDEEVAELAIRLDKFVLACAASGSDQFRIATKSLKHLEKGLSAIFSCVSSFPSDGDVCLLRQHEEQLSEYKKDFSDTRRGLLSFDIEDVSDLGSLMSRVDRSLFDCALNIRKLLHARSSTSSASSDSDAKGVKLPKLEVPTFDGNILGWKTFWEQFRVSVHNRSGLADSEKLAYLRHTLKGGAAKSVVEGLTSSGKHYGLRCGCPGSPIALETLFGWVLAGSTDSCAPAPVIATHHTTLLSWDDLLRRFWEVEKVAVEKCLTPDERSVMDHFKDHHTRLENGRFVVPLPKKPGTLPLGESRSRAVRRFLSFEHSLHSKELFPEFKAVIDEYFDMGHAELVPAMDLKKPLHSTFYVPLHAVRKESSTTTKVRAVFDASAKTSTGVSLNDTLLVGPTVHSSLVDVLLHFRFHRVALIADVSKMYRAISLTPLDRDLHRFVWRNSLSEPLQDFRMTRVTFGVSASSFLANMCVKQNALDHASAYPLAAQAVEDDFYVDDGLTGADSVEKAIELHVQLQALFDKAGFLLRKWNASELEVLEHIEPELRDQQSVHMMFDPDEYTKTLGVQWNARFDHFRMTIAEPPTHKSLTKRTLASDVAKMFDVLGWFAPVTIKAKILLQRLWEEGIGWDDTVSSGLEQAWAEWRRELDLLMDKRIPRCYYPKNAEIVYKQLHGFCDASERGYAGVVYLRLVDAFGCIHTSLVMAKTKVAPIKRVSIPRLELCGALLLAQLLHHCQDVFGFPSEDVFAWTDSTIVLNWLVGNPRRFKTYVGNRTSLITELVAPNRWNHVEGSDNPADCASRGLLPSELLAHELWWDGPSWLRLGIHCWPVPITLPPNHPSEEAGEICCHVAFVSPDPVIHLDRFSSFTRLRRVTAWVMRFLHNCKRNLSCMSGPLSVDEIGKAVSYWISLSQASHFSKEIAALKAQTSLWRSSSLLSLSPFLDEDGLLRIGGRQRNSKLTYESQHPTILHENHPVSKLLIRAEHLRLLHAGPLLVLASLGRRYHFVGGRKLVRTVTRSCVTCRRKSQRPQPPMMGQLPMERVTPASVFSRVGVDYAGPVLVKYGHVRKPTVIKTYEEVPWRQYLDSIVLTTGQRSERATVEARLDLCQHSRELFKGELHSPHNMGEVLLEVLHSSFPQATKVWCPLRNEFPPYSLTRAEIRDHLLRTLLPKEIKKFLEGACCSHKICSMIAPDQARFSSTCDETAETGDEGF